MISKRGDKVERARSVKLWCGLLCDFGWIGDIEDSKTGAVVLFDIEKGSAIGCCMEYHRLACHPCKFGQLRMADENDFATTDPRCCMAGHCEDGCSREGLPASYSNVMCCAPTLTVFPA